MIYYVGTFLLILIIVSIACFLSMLFFYFRTRKWNEGNYVSSSGSDLSEWMC